MQLIDPVVQAFPVLQEVPAEQGTHVPAPLQTPPGHAEPAGTLPLDVQTGEPVVQLIVPVVHGFDGLQDVPDAHATHVPLPSHMPPAQSVPAGELPLVVQTGAPLEQSIAPV
jgi:hypothetical protein